MAGRSLTETTLLGKRVKIAMGCDDEGIARYLASQSPDGTPASHECWQRLGQEGEVVAVCKDEGSVAFTLQFADGSLSGLIYASHCRVLEAQAPGEAAAPDGPPVVRTGPGGEFTRDWPDRRATE